MEKGSYFIGFGGFEAKEQLWGKVFSAFDGWAELRNIFAISKQPGASEELDIDATQLNRRLNGSEGWGMYAGNFLSYRKNPEQYRTYWMSHRFVPAEWIAIFQAFLESVPPESADCTQVQQKFWEPARKVCGYLKAVIQYCQDPTAQDGRDWVSAGMYVLICLFLQNGKRAKPQFYEPPAPYTLAEMKKAAAAVIPIGGMGLPEPKLQFDLFAHVKAGFEEMEAPQDSPGTAQDTILPAVVRQSKRMVVCPLKLVDTQGFRSQAFRIETTVKKIQNTWQPRLGLEKMPQRTQKYGEKEIHTAVLDQEYMSEEVGVRGVIISVEVQGTQHRVQTFQPEGSGKAGASDAVGLRCGPWKSILVDIDRDGYPADREAEALLESCCADLSGGNAAVEVKYRECVCRELDPCFQNYRILDWQTKEEISKYPVRDPVSGARGLGIKVPCPGRLVILQMDPGSLRGDLLAVTGHLYGLYGCEQNQAEARAIMMDGAVKKQDPQMAFQYGAYLKCMNDTFGAESYLRMAAKEIAGARLELAELLKDRGTPEAIAEARQLVDGLWERGYRSYGGMSIDLLGEYA